MLKRSPGMTSADWTSWRLTLVSLGAVLVGAVMIGAVALSTRPDMSALTRRLPPTTMALAASATATPTPRVIAIPETVTPPAPTQAPATNPTPTASAIPSAPITQEPPPLATVFPLATASPSLTPTVTAPPPTVAPTTPASPNVRIAFAAEDWVGGFYRGDGQAYGRPWVAVYGASGDYPRASLPFALEAAPTGPAIVTIAGLDDEWAARNEIALEVNGQVVFSGPSPFANWDGVGNGSDADWTSVPFSIPAGSLRAGPNEIALANLNPAGNFNAPPYVLVSDVALDLLAATGLAAQPATERVEPSKDKDSDRQVSDDRKKPQKAKEPQKAKKAKKAKKRK